MLKKGFGIWKRVIAILTILLSPFSILNSQTSFFRNYSVDEGLPFVEVYTIYQDAQGNLWSGGYGGLSKFNGVSFTKYSPHNGLPNHWVTSITEDSRQDLWIGTIEGVSRYSGGKFTNFSQKDGLPDNYINCLLRDEKNVLWIGTAKGIARFNGERFITDTAQGPHSLSILCFYQQPNSSRIWIGTTGGVFLCENGVYKQVPMAISSDDDIHAITMDREGKIIAGTSEGLFRLENGVFTLLFTPAEFEMPAVNCMLADREGVIWVGANNGLFSFDGKKFSHVNISGNVNANSIGSIFLDYEGNLWLGTHAGLFRFRGEAFRAYGTAEGLYGNFIYGISMDRQGRLWVGTEQAGVFIYEHDRFSALDVRKGLLSNKVNMIFPQDDGSMWLGTDKGLSIVNDGRITNFSKADGIGSEKVNVIYRDQRGRTWLGGGRSITLCDNGKFVSYSIPENFTGDFDIWCMHDDSKGNLWIGTYTGGAYVYDGNTFRNAEQFLRADEDSYFAICEDKKGNLYFGTLGGLLIYDGHNTIHVTENDGLSSELIYSMAFDSVENVLWIGTNQGISRFNIDAYNTQGKIVITTFGKEEGFTGVESNTNGTHIDANRDIWFGTVNGLMRYTPGNYKTNSAYAKTSITGIRLFYSDTTLSENAELEWDENNLSFDYIGICLTNPSKVRYKFMLEGFDADWSPPTADRTARYSNIPPGTYTFRVVSCNNEGLWNDVPAQFTFTIATPFWKRSWFWLLLTLASLSLLTGAVLFRIRQVRNKERRETESQVAMARNELKALRAQMNPHFVFNSLNSIQHFILTNKSSDAGKYLNKFARLMRIILNNSEKSVITLAEEFEYLKLYLELEEMRFENKFEWKIEVSGEIDTDFFEIPAMLLQPYIENAILHGLMPKKEKGHLLISVSLKGETLVCTVEDDGIGRKKAREIRQLSNRKDHTSLGMKITHDRLELINRLHGSQLSLTITDLHDNNGEPCGTRVEIFIPVS